MFTRSAVMELGCNLLHTSIQTLLYVLSQCCHKNITLGIFTVPEFVLVVIDVCNFYPFLTYEYALNNDIRKGRTKKTRHPRRCLSRNLPICLMPYSVFLFLFYSAVLFFFYFRYEVISCWIY